MKNVGEQQLLVLLFVMQPERDDGLDGGPVLVADVAVEQGQHGLVDMPPVRMHLVHRGPREQSSLRTRMPRPERLVVRIEEVMKTGIEGPVAHGMRLEQHGLEEPRGVRQVPFLSLIHI